MQKDDLFDQKNCNGKKRIVPVLLKSPLSGTVVALSDVEDEVFSSGVLGEGYAIKPEKKFRCKVYAPCDGQITVIPDTLHAMGMASLTGLDILIHVGLNTNTLKGRYFKVFVKEGDIVHEGDLLMSFSPLFISMAGYKTVTSIVVNDCGDPVPTKIECSLNAKIKAGEQFFSAR